MSLATWHRLILLMTLVSYPIMSVEYSPYVSKFEYVPRFHPSRNPDCPLRFDGNKLRDDFADWNRPAIEVRAVLSSCSKFEDNYEEGAIRNCARKIVISMRFNNVGKTNTQEKFVVIDHVLDPTSMKKIPLRNPYVIKVRQEPVVQLYGLKFQSVVNAEAREEVINNEIPNYTGCNVDSENPTCGRTVIRGEPVPFSQGFCCSCTSKTDPRRLWAGSNNSTADLIGESSYNGANKAGNRLAPTEKHASSVDSMAERQGTPGKVRSSKKASERRANDSQTTAYLARLPNKTMDESCLVKEARDQCTASPRASTGSVGRSSTLPGSSPSANEIESNAKPFRGHDLSDRGSGSGRDGANKRDHAEEHRSSRDEPVADVQSPTGGNDLPFSASRKDADNRDFQSSDSKTGSRKFGKVHVTRWKESKDILMPIEEQFRSTRYSPEKIIQVTSVYGVKETEGSGCCEAESVRGNKRKVGKKKRRFRVTPSIDSLAIQPPMHLNEPLKNLSTGVLNTGSKGSGGGNLNRVMESTSPDIMVESFKEKQGQAGYFQSNERNKKASNALEPVRSKFELLAKLASEKNVPLRNDSLTREKKLLARKTIKNYTPLKRTLKDISYRDDYQHRDSETSKKHRGKRNLRHSGKRLRNRRHSHLVPGRWRRFRNRSKRDKGDRGNAGRSRDKSVRVYIDEARLVRGPSNDRSRTQAFGKKRSEKKEKASKSRNKDSQENVDKQIEEKFSRISDALKEDAMGPKAMTETTNEKTDNTKKTSSDSTESGYKFEQESQEGSDTASNRNPSIEVLDEDVDKLNGNRLDQPNSLNNEKQSTISSLVISPTQKSNDQLQPTPSLFFPQLNKETKSWIDFFTSTEKQSTEGTQALIMIDLFRVATDLVTTKETLTPETFTEITEEVYKAATPKGIIEKAIGRFPGFVPVHRTLRTTQTTLMIEESTTMAGNVTEIENTTTTVEATKITDETFRASIRPMEDRARQTLGSPEFHKEIGMEDITFPDAPTITDFPSVGREGSTDFGSTSKKSRKPDEKGQMERDSVGEVERHATPSVIKNKDSLGSDEYKNLRGERSLYDGNPYGRGGSTQTDSRVKLSFEAGNVNLVKEKVGVTRSFIREQRNYVQFKVKRQGEGKEKDTGNRISSDSYKARKKYRRNRLDKRTKVSNSKLIKNNDVVHHPWYLETVTPQYAISRKSFNRVRPSKKVPKELRHVENVSGRILPPCARNEDSTVGYYEENSANREKNAYKRGRRLLSVQRFKKTKATSDHHSSKDRKKVREDESSYVKDTEDEYSDTSEHGKRLKSINDKDRAKSKKRDTARLKRKKDKNRSKKQSMSTVEEPLEDYNYFLPEDYEDAKTNPEKTNAEDSLENYDTNPSVDETIDKDQGSKLSDNFQDTLYNLDSSAPIDFDESLMDDLKTENRARSIAEDKAAEAEIRDDRGEMAGKDFEISLTGKIHLESDPNGRPVSISFNAVPEFLRKDSIADAKANDGGVELESSMMDVFDTGPSDFFADPQSSLSAPIDPLADRSNVKEYYPNSLRVRGRNTDNFQSEPLDSRRLLRLQKKSIGSREKPVKREAQFSKDSSKIKEERDGFKENLKSSEGKCESVHPGQTGNLVSEQSEMKDNEESDHDLNDSSSIKDGNQVSSDDSVQNTASDPVIVPQISVDISDPAESSLVNVDFDGLKKFTENLTSAVSDTDTGKCYVMHTTLQRIDLPEMTTISDKLGALSNASLASYHDYDAYSSSTGSNERLNEIANTIGYEDRMEESRTGYPKSAAVQFSDNLSEYNPSGGESKESIEKKNMEAVSEFVKKLEKLVPESNSSNDTDGHTLIHLKKFIIIPDNRSLWTVKELVEPKNFTGSEATNSVAGRDDRISQEDDDKGSKNNSEDAESSESNEKSSAEKSNVIKEAISSAIEDDDSKSGTSEEKLDEAKSKEEDGAAKKPPEAPVESEFSEGSEERETEPRLEVARNLRDLAKLREGTGLESRNTGDQFLQTSPGEAKESAKKGNDVCNEYKSNIKEKRETSKSNGRSSGKGGQRKSGKRNKAKKRRRKKRKKKTKKNSGKKKSRDSGKSKSRWPFKRNLLMLVEKEHLDPSKERYESKRMAVGKSSRSQDSRNSRSVNKLRRENEVKEPHIRGGQDCGRYEYPPDVDPEKYMESTHCLRFSDLWYSVYQLEEPVIEHTVHLQIYQKRSSPDGSVSWSDLTNGSTIRLGTFDRHRRNKDTIAFSYNDVGLKPNANYNLDSLRERLLVPSTVTGERSNYPLAEGWSGEYLVVRADKINEDARDCDKAGVGFAAFVGQPNRCERVSGSCLKNQPLDYWRHDMEARESGRSGCYFLSNFAWVPSEAIKYNVNGTGSREFLALEYHSPHVSVIDVELRADYNALLRPGSSGRLAEIHVDNTAMDYTVITLLVSNEDSFLSSYRARITSCPRGLPVSWSNAESPTKIIPPHQDRKIILDLYGRLSFNEFSCTALLLNRDGEPVATRKIKVRKMDRCSCSRHCTCTCLGDARGMSCQPLLLESYHAAGFHGPIPSTSVESVWSSPIAIVSLFITSLLSLLLLLGFLKWMIGMCVPAVSRWGLDTLIEADKMNEYFEKDLKKRSVVFDEYSAPVHPDTGLRTVRICNRKLEIFLNLTFFFIYPFTICCLYCARPLRYKSTSSTEAKVKSSFLRGEPRPSYSEMRPRRTESRDQTNLMSEKDESPAMISLSTYGDSMNSKMEEEDTKYVIDELKKSQESLQNHYKYKKNHQDSEGNTSSN